ncbi:metal transporter [Desulfococcus sp.]|uniref:metal transporter n=1 Tax=Desulfococcus sp. TaxID=2025834 RepID=UPI0035932CE6
MSTVKQISGKCLDEKLLGKMMSHVNVVANHLTAMQNYCVGYSKYLNDFMLPFLISTNYFNRVEQDKLIMTSPLETFRSYMDLLSFNLELSNKGLTAGMEMTNEYFKREVPAAVTALINTVLDINSNDMEEFTSRHSRMTQAVTRIYPEAIRNVESEFGFHFERGTGVKFSETDRFLLYQVLPTDPSVPVREDGKPLIILPPFVLGANILAFLPGENKSYTHCFANQGIPTYIRIMKDIQTTPAVQVMSGEDDARDTRVFCEQIMARHGKPVTLNGYCQGGFSGICDILSGELDGLVDALITCVSPMDGTRSHGLKNFLFDLPARFNDLAYGTKMLANGNKVADGNLMGWVYKLKSIQSEAPVVAFLRDLMMLSPRDHEPVKISKTAAALNYWLQNERSDLPLSITEMSFASYNIPITPDGTLPIRLFGKPLNFKRIQEKGIKWLICYGERDDLVEKETALAPLDYIDAEVSAFPKGHVAIATSWSDPKSACALHTRFGDKNYRGPVRFHLDMELSSQTEDI